MSEFQAEYATLGHQIQTCVAADIALGSSAASPKMLRTGLNIVFVEQAALASLLIEKGVITLEEYQAALKKGLQQEVARLEADLSARMGSTVRSI